MKSTSPLPDADGTVPRRGVLNSLAQAIAGVKTFLAEAVFSSGLLTTYVRAASASLLLRSDLGAGSTDVCTLVGSTVADASVNAAAKLWGAATGIGGTRSTYAFVQKAPIFQGVFVVDSKFVTNVGAIQIINSGAGDSGIFFESGASSGGSMIGVGSGYFGISSTNRNQQFRVTGDAYSGAAYKGAFEFYRSGGDNYLDTKPLVYAQAGAAHAARLLSLVKGSVEQFGISDIGRIDQSGTDSSGTPGAATINKPIGTSAIAAGASSCVITNSLVAAGDWVNLTPHARDATCKELIAVCTAGAITVSGSANATTALAFSWEVKKRL